MKKIICTFISIAVLSVLSIVSTSAQSYGTRVEATIPFDFVVGKKTFKAGSYELLILGGNNGVYTASLKDEDGRNIYRTIALRSYNRTSKDCRMEFSVLGDERYLSAIKTPDVGYSFVPTYRKQTMAQAKQISVPTSGSSPQF